MRSAAVLAGALAAGMSASPASADPVIGRSVARYDMNEAPGRTVLTDTDNSGAVLNGTIGATVGLNGATHTYATDMPGTGAAPGHVDVVPHSPDLNPGSGNFAFTIRYYTTYSFGNIVQKGQGTQVGGYWKLENPKRQPRCFFRGRDGEVQIGRIANWQTGAQLTKGWHTITCERINVPAPGEKPYVRMWVDGVAQPKAVGYTGTIENTARMSIGGKSDCGGTITCDYFVGQIDRLEIRKG